VGISFGSVQAILTDERFLLDESTDSWLANRNGPGLTFQDILFIATRMIQDNMGPSFRSRIKRKKTKKKNPTKQQRVQWKHPGSLPLKKFKRMPSAGKMIPFFWDS
jgi:hypothetical protein